MLQVDDPCILSLLLCFIFDFIVLPSFFYYYSYQFFFLLLFLPVINIMLL